MHCVTFNIPEIIRIIKDQFLLFAKVTFLLFTRAT